MASLPTPAPTPPAPTPPPQPAGPATGLRPFRWTVAQFHQAGETGAFKGRRVKLIRGLLTEEGPMNAPYAMAVEKPDADIRVAFGKG